MTQQITTTKKHVEREGNLGVTKNEVVEYENRRTEEALLMLWNNEVAMVGNMELEQEEEEEASCAVQCVFFLLVHPPVLDRVGL